MPSAYVILVNESDDQIGTMEKMEAHKKALLHRAFSVFIFNSKGEMLLQQRADRKYHSAGLWTNACCSHPFPGEDTQSGALRRLQEELGFITPIEKLYSFIYRAEFENGLTEFEFDHVFAGIYDEPVFPDQQEIKDFCFRGMKEIEASLLSHPWKYTAWFAIAFPAINEWACKKFGKRIAELC